jgi:hypothetical protein
MYEDRVQGVKDSRAKKKYQRVKVSKTLIL